MLVTGFLLFSYVILCWFLNFLPVVGLQHITKSPPEDRESVVGSYFRHDVLSLHHSVPHTPSVLEHHCVSPRQLPLYAHFHPTHASTPHPLQQVAARLVNTLASLRSGRDYLCSAGCRVLRVLVPCLQGDGGVKMDINTADMILATLQKLSLRCVLYSTIYLWLTEL
jgi:hypothetical protein